MAPEMIIAALCSDQTYGLEIDFWAIGVVLYEMLVGHPPFQAEDKMQLYTKILNHPVLWPENVHVDEDAKNFIGGLLQKYPAKRIGSFTSGYEDEDTLKIRSHPYFDNLDWRLIDSGEIGKINLPG